MQERESQLEPRDQGQLLIREVVEEFRCPLFHFCGENVDINRCICLFEVWEKVVRLKKADLLS